MGRVTSERLEQISGGKKARMRGKPLRWEEEPSAQRKISLSIRRIKEKEDMQTDEIGGQLI